MNCLSGKNKAYEWIRATGRAFIFVTLMAAGGHAAADIGPQLTDDPTKPWHISADEISYDKVADQYIAKGNVTITKQNKRLEADVVRFDHKTMQASALGQVMLTTGEDILTGSRMEVDLRAETGTIYNGSIFIKEKHFYITGDRIEKVGEFAYTAKKVSFTSCDGDPPAWKITGRDLNVRIEGYGTVKHAALWANDIPVLYMPYFVFPAKQKRQSGLLFPEAGQSDRKGIYYIQPFYWAINESSDATFYEHYMGRRGHKIGAEYRYVLNDRSKGTVMFDFLDDRKIDDGTGDSSSEYGFGDDTFLRTNSDRYWFRMKADQNLPLGFSAKLDLDIMSDQDYLLEFKSGMTGFKETDSYFEKTFGRDLDEADDTERLNRLNLNKIWPKYSLNAEVRWFDNVIARQDSPRIDGGEDEENDTLQRLPFIEFDASRQQILASPVYFNLDSEYNNFFREDGTRGQRVDIHPRFFLPYRYKNYFTFEPSIGLRETAWLIDEYDKEQATTDDRLFSREIFDLKLDLSTDIYNTFDIGIEGIDRIKHTIRPQIIYEFIPDQRQDKSQTIDESDLFDSVDLIERRNLVTYSITNTLTSRSEKPRPDENDAPPDYKYHQFCRFKLQQSFDINEAREDDPEKFLNQRRREPFSPIFGEIDLVLSRYLALQADFEWSTYDTTFLSNNVATSIADKRGDRLFVEYRLTRESTTRDAETGDMVERDDSESFYTDLTLKLSNRLGTYAVYERNIEERTTLQYGLGFEYTSQCWSLGCGYKREDEEKKFTVMVNLHGLGARGKKFAGRSISSPLEIY